MEMMEVAINLRSTLHSPAPGLPIPIQTPQWAFPVLAQPLPHRMESKGSNKAAVYFRTLYMVDDTQTALYKLSPLILITLSLDGSIPIITDTQWSSRKATCAVTWLGMIEPQKNQHLQSHVPNSSSSPGACPARTCSP